MRSCKHLFQFQNLRIRVGSCLFPQSQSEQQIVLEEASCLRQEIQLEPKTWFSMFTHIMFPNQNVKNKQDTLDLPGKTLLWAEISVWSYFSHYSSAGEVQFFSERIPHRRCKQLLSFRKLKTYTWKWSIRSKAKLSKVLLVAYTGKCK